MTYAFLFPEFFTNHGSKQRYLFCQLVVIPDLFRKTPGNAYLLFWGHGIGKINAGKAEQFLLGVPSGYVHLLTDPFGG